MTSPNVHPVTLKLSQETIDTLDLACKNRCTSRSELLRGTLERMLSEDHISDPSVVLNRVERDLQLLRTMLKKEGVTDEKR